MASFGCRRGWAPGAQIQTKAVVLKHAEPDGFTMIGIMGAYGPQSRSFWWAATPMIAEPGMLESLYERCKFAMNGGRVVSFCVLGNAVTTSTAQEYAGSLEQGLTKAQQTLQDNQNLMAVSAGARGVAFDLKEKSGVDMNTPPGVRPTLVRSVTSTESEFLVDVACGCGDAALTLDRNYDFVSLKKK